MFLVGCRFRLWYLSKAKEALLRGFKYHLCCLFNIRGRYLLVSYTHAGVIVQQFSSENGTIRKLFMTKIEKKGKSFIDLNVHLLTLLLLEDVFCSILHAIMSINFLSKNIL